METSARIAWMAGLRTVGVMVAALVFSFDAAEAQSSDYTVLQVPGCESTTPWAVNESGDVVGSALSCAGDDDEFAFLYRDGVYSSIDVPGAIVTIPTDINDRGIVVGYFRTPESELGAFTFWRGEYQTITVPGVELVPQGINNRGDIVGWIPTVPYQAFLLAKNGDFTILSAVGDLQGLQAWKINASGVIVGTAFSPAAGLVSFVHQRGETSIAALPGLYLAVNNRGDVAAEIPGAGFVVYRNGVPLELNHPETSYTIFDLSNRWAVGAIAEGRGYVLRLP